MLAHSFSSLLAGSEAEKGWQRSTVKKTVLNHGSQEA